jgi:hypothetical protein
MLSFAIVLHPLGSADVEQHAASVAHAPVSEVPPLLLPLPPLLPLLLPLPPLLLPVHWDWHFDVSQLAALLMQVWQAEVSLLMQPL